MSTHSISTATRRRTDPPGRLATAPVLPTLTAPRLRLRWLDTADIADLRRLVRDCGDDGLSGRGGSRHDDAGIWLEAVQRGFDRGDLYQWGIALRGDDRVVGTALLASIDHLQGRAEIGCVLARDHRGRRYAAEALTVLLEHAFGTLGLRRVEADVDPRNADGLRTLERLGFRREGYLRQRWRVGAEVQDSLVMGLLASEWPGAG